MDATTISHKQLNQLDQLHIPPAQIWFGPDETALSEAIKWLQKTIAHGHSDATCYTCNAIRTHEYASVYWLKPEKNYVLEDLEDVFQLCAFKRDAHDPFFIIFQRAETLSAQCANSLLKLVEEPPTGYHFLFLTNKLEAILPTIRSRCHIHTLSAVADATYPSTLIELLLEQKNTALAFAKELDAIKIDEVESMKLLNDLITICTNKTKSSIEHNDTAAYAYWNAVHSVVLSGLKQPPMAGSSKLFWKNLYLQLRVK